jgi:hypothetical protein
MNFVGVKTKPFLKALKQAVASLGIGVLLCAAWGGFIILTSPDMGDESPISIWVAPLFWWDGVLQKSGLALYLKSWDSILGRTAFIITGFFVIFAPFIAFFSFVSLTALRIFQRKSARNSLS